MENNVLIFQDPKSGGYEPVTGKTGSRIPHYFRSKRTGFIFYRRSLNRLGIPPISKNTYETTFGRAQVAAEVILQRHKNKHLGIDDSKAFGRTSTKSFADVANEILKERTPGMRLKTRVQHKFYLETLIELFGSRDINSISVRDFNYEILRLKATKKRKTFFDYAKHMNLVMHYAYNQKYATHDLQFPNPDKEKKAGTGRRYSHEEMEALFDKASGDIKDQLVVGYENVMRLKEMLHLTWDRVNLETGEVTLRAEDVKTGSKTGRGRRLVVSPNSLAILRRRREKVSGPYVFPSPIKKNLKTVDSNKTAWNALKKSAGITGRARWHDLRHTGLTVMLLEKRLNPLSVSEFAGVSMATIQKVYLKPQARDTMDVGQALSLGNEE